MGEDKLADGRVERKSVHAVPGGVDQHGAGTIDHVARGDLLGAFLQAIIYATKFTSYPLPMKPTT